MIELRLLRYFVAVAETEHVGRASRTLHVSQSPLSRQIRQLEEAVGLSLFDREKQRLHLTNDGRWLLERARRVLAGSEALERDAGRLARGEAGTLRLGFVKSAMWTRLLPRALQRFRARRPDVAIELRNAHSPTQIAALRRGDLDLALTHEAPASAELSSVQLADEPLCLAVPPDHALATRRRVAPRDVDGADWIVLEGADRSAALLAACARAGFTPAVRFEVSDQGTVLGLVDAGMGLALLPESASPLGGVTLRRLPWLSLSRRLYAVTRDAGTSPAASELVACLTGSRAK